MPLDAGDIQAIADIIDQRVPSLVNSAVNQAQFGGPTVQVAPKDLVYLGNGRYVSESENRMYEKATGGRLIALGGIPEPA